MARRFRIALSFAGEKRAFVKEVAEILAQEFGKEAILYDKYHEAEFSHSELAFELPELYSEQSDLIVAVLCPDYENKEWCGLEWKAIYGLLKKGETKMIMLTRFGRAEGKGLHGLAGFIDLDEKEPKQTAALIRKRLELIEMSAQKKNDGTAQQLTTIPTSQTIHNNLPRLPHFFGREAELKTILGALSPTARTWGVLIDGPGGMGKTSLAIRAAELAPARDFDRIIFLTAKNRELTSNGERRLHDFVMTGYLEMLSEMGRQLKLPAIAEKAEAERAAHIQAALADTRALLLLDNLESLAPENRDRLYAFLTNLPYTCKAIVTSRRRHDIDARIVRLEKLDHDAAMKFLASLAIDRPPLQRATADERESLYTETAGNPLVMRWLAGQLGHGQCRTVACALAFLRSAPSENNPLEFIFGDLLETFSPEETKALSALTYYTLPVEVTHIAEIASLTPIACKTALEDLTGRSLVIADAGEEYYVLTPLVADFLRRARPGTVQEAGDRLATQAHALILENGGDKHGRFPLLDAAWSRVEPAISLFVAGGNARLQEVCRELNSFLNFTGRWETALALHNVSEERAVADKDFPNAGWRAYHAGMIYYGRGKGREVLECANRAKEHWRSKPSGKRERGIAMRLLGLGYTLQQDFPKAIKAHQSSLRLRERMHSGTLDVVRALSSLGEAEHLGKMHRDAEKHYREALRMARELHSIESIATCAGNLCAFLLDRKEWLQAEQMGRDALVSSEKMGWRELVAENNYRLALSLLKQGKTADAENHSQEAVRIYTELGSPELRAATDLLKECSLPKTQTFPPLLF